MSADQLDELEEPVTALSDTTAAVSYALLTDGTCVGIRAAGPGDWQAVHDFAAALGRDSLYHRFFGAPGDPGSILADLVCKPGAQPGGGALLAVHDGAVVGVADWHRGADPREAEVAFAVADALHGRGVATLLAEHMLDEADRVGIHRFTALTQGENRAMLEVFATLGLPSRRTWEYGDVALAIDLDLDAAARGALLDATARRERIADEASLHHLLAPRSIAVIGDPDDPGTRRLREHLRDFPGELLETGPDGIGLPAVGPDLAVITSPPAAAVEAARRCADTHVSALIVTATGFERAEGRALLDICHGAGMRLVGPGSLGVAVPGDAAGFTALLAPARPEPGSAGVAVQSGGVGLALLSRLGRLGIGVSVFAAVGEKYDVSATDLLMHWEQDPAIRLGLLHVESFGNPRKFARVARRLSRRIPLLAVDPEQSPSQARTALYAQAGITAVPSLGALVCAAALAAHQPVPQGPRIHVIGNTRGMVALAVQACAKAGLEVVGAVDLTPAADAERLADAVAHATRPQKPGGTAPDASVFVALAPTVPDTPALDIAVSRVPDEVPVLAVLTDQPETVTLESFGPAGRSVPCFNDAAAAASALAAVFAASGSRRRPDDAPPASIPGIDQGVVRRVIEGCLKDAPRGRTLYPSERGALFDALHLATGPHGEGDVTITAWQDAVFGPLITCAARGSGVPASALLVPASERDLARLARSAAGSLAPGLAGLLARAALLVDTCAEAASVQLRVTLDGAVARVVGGEVAIVPAHRADPYLRRLRRAPVE
jgi:GNAT superfamily N-acetyltransferase